MAKKTATIEHSNKILLIIFDGFGETKSERGNAIRLAKMNTINQLRKKYPWTLLKASGNAVGLPKGYQGNSEVGHFTMGAGRVSFQSLEGINRSIQDKSFFKKKALVKACHRIREANQKGKKSALHLMGMISDEGVHSHIDHLFALLELAKKQKAFPIFIHAILDGRDVPERSAKKYLKKIQQKIMELKLNEPSNASGNPPKAQIATVIGRYYAMDRDSNWDRTKIAYDLWVHGKGKRAKNPIQAIEEIYGKNGGGEPTPPEQPLRLRRYDLWVHGKGKMAKNPIQAVEEVYGENGRGDLPAGRRGASPYLLFTSEHSEREGEAPFRRNQAKWRGRREPLSLAASPYQKDYYMPPIVLNQHGCIRSEDSVIFFNYRTDRARQITDAFVNKKFDHFKTNHGKISFVAMGPYTKDAPVAFPMPAVRNNLGQVLAQHHIPQLRIAETEKYAHVTYFFNSQVETVNKKEDRIMIDSPKCPSYAEKPKMSAYPLTKRLIQEIKKEKYPFILANYANADLVGHSGNLKATIQCCKVLDDCLGKIVPVAITHDYKILLTGDHGNAEQMFYADGSPCPSHTKNPVLFLMISKKSEKKQLKKNKGLQDIAPTILEMMNIKKPQEMEGESLIQKKQYH